MGTKHLKLDYDIFRSRKWVQGKALPRANEMSCRYPTGIPRVSCEYPTASYDSLRYRRYPTSPHFTGAVYSAKLTAGGMLIPRYSKISYRVSYIYPAVYCTCPTVSFGVLVIPIDLTSRVQSPPQKLTAGDKAYLTVSHRNQR